MYKYLKPYDEANFEQILSEMRSDPEIEIIKPDLFYYSNSIYDCKTDKIQFKSKIPLNKEDLSHCEWFKENDTYIRYSVVALAKKGTNYKRQYPSPYPRFSLDLISPLIKLPPEISYEINGTQVTLPLDKVIALANQRTYSFTESVFRVLNLENLGSYYTINEVTSSLVSFLRDMTENFLWKDILETNQEDALGNIKKEFDDEKFIKFWISKHKITAQQLACEHDSSDQFSTDGTWYNCVGTCKKCLLSVEIQSFDSEECQAAFEVWQAALEANK